MLDRQWAEQAGSTADPADFIGVFARQVTASAGRAAGLVVAALEGARADPRPFEWSDTRLGQHAAQCLGLAVRNYLEQGAARVAGTGLAR